MPAHAHTRHFFSYSQEIISKISSLHSRLRISSLHIQTASVQGLQCVIIGIIVIKD